MNKIQVGMAVLAMAAVSAQAQDNTYDTRSIAMGGIGVASANARNAALANPAMLASAPQDKFDLELPVLSGRIMDPDSIIDNLDTLNTNAKNMNTALINFQAAMNAAVPSPTTVASTAAAAKIQIDAFNRSLGLMSDKPLMGAMYVGTILSVPSKKYAFALQLDGRVEGGGILNYSVSDRTLVGNFATALASCSVTPATPTSVAACNTAMGQIGTSGSITGLTSKFNVRAVGLTEVGISFATQFKELSDINVGITPKFIQLTSYDYKLDSQSGDNKITLDQGKKKDSLFTLDVGAVKLFKTEKGNDVRAGLVAKNILSKSTTTILGNKVDIAPQLTAGGAYSTGLITAGADLDLIANKPLLPGINKESQYLRLGAEFDAWRWAQVRVGYRHDLKGNNPGLPSLGLGVSVLGLHTDLSVAVAGKKEVAAAWQLGFNF